MLVELVRIEDGDPLGAAMQDLVMTHMSPVVRASRQRGAQLGIGRASCNAAVIVEMSADTHPDSFGQYDRITVAGTDCYLLYGNSRLFTGLDDVALSEKSSGRQRISAATPSKSGEYEEHAEQVAIRTAEQRGLPFWHDAQARCHVFGSLDPCKDCAPWLQRRPERWVYHVGATDF